MVSQRSGNSKKLAIILKNKGVESIEDQVAYLKNIDPTSIDEHLEDIGVTPANIETLVESLERVQTCASSSTASMRPDKHFRELAEIARSAAGFVKTMRKNILGSHHLAHDERASPPASLQNPVMSPALQSFDKLLKNIDEAKQKKIQKQDDQDAFREDILDVQKGMLELQKDMHQELQSGTLLQKRNFWVALAGLCVIILTALLTVLKAISII